MTFHIEPFQARHVDELELQTVQVGLRPFLKAGHVLQLAEQSFAFTGFYNGTAIGCAGLVEMWPGRDCAWSLLADCGPRAFIYVHRTVSRFLDARRTRRTEMSVDVEHEEGQRWAELLGFQKEGCMRAYSPDGRDAFLYARIRDDRR